jgi:vacuolar-type H+-ATPase subunit F/Vma7
MAFEKGHKLSKGRPSKADEEKNNTIFLTAIKELKDVNSDDEARIEIAKDLYNSQRGLIFIAEHLFGKPKESIDHTTAGEKINTIINLGSGIKPNEATE